MKKLLAILGPTATGKTDIGLDLAKKFNGELVACDSRQVYKGLDIGTGKEPGKSSVVSRKQSLPSDEGQSSDSFWLINGIRIWMYDVAEPKEQYSVYEYIRDASKVIDDIERREKLPIVVGGTGLYLRGLLEGFDQIDAPIDPKLREELEKLTVGELQKKLTTLSPTALEKMNQSDRQNPRRLIRKIEQVSMNPYMTQSSVISRQSSEYDVLKIGLTAPRSVLNSRIDVRLDSRIDQGLIEEGQMLLSEGLSLDRMRQLGLEYGVLADLLEGKISEAEFKQQLKSRIHQYAKRQMTWFKRDPEIKWFDVTGADLAHRVESEVQNWYNYQNNGNAQSRNI